MPKSLRDWAAPSYNVSNGRQASSLKSGGQAGMGGTAKGATQISSAQGAGQKGAPGTSALNHSGSADRGRREWGGSEVS
jgi:hypothetical protein